MTNSFVMVNGNAQTVVSTSGSSILKGDGNGGFANATSATDYAPATTGSSILKASSGGFANAVAGTDYVAPATTVNGHALSANVTVSASDITTGTLPAAQLPNPTASTLGGVKSLASVAHQFLTSISTAGVPAAAQPADSDISFTDITTGNVSPSSHGYAPKGTGSATQYLDGTGAYSTPAGSAAGNSIVQFSSLSTGTGVPIGTNYLGDAANTTTLGNVEVNIPFSGTITNMYAWAAGSPGGTATFVYTVMKNDTATSMTCTTPSGGQSSNTSSNSFSVAAGDKLAIRVVVGTGANLTFHYISLTIKN